MTEKRKVGRPKAEISADLVEEMAAIGATLDEIAAVGRVAPSTLDDRIAKEPELAAALGRGRALGRVTLRRHQWHAAGNGSAAMLIWLGKQVLGQRDVIPAEKPLDALSDAELATAIAKVRALVANSEEAGSGTGAPTRH